MTVRCAVASIPTKRSRHCWMKRREFSFVQQVEGPSRFPFSGGPKGTKGGYHNNNIICCTHTHPPKSWWFAYFFFGFCWKDRFSAARLEGFQFVARGRGKEPVGCVIRVGVGSFFAFGRDTRNECFAIRFPWGCSRFGSVARATCMNEEFLCVRKFGISNRL